MPGCARQAGSGRDSGRRATRQHGESNLLARMARNRTCADAAVRAVDAPIEIDDRRVGNAEAHSVAVGDDDGGVPMVQHITDHIPSSASLSRPFMGPHERDSVCSVENWLSVGERTTKQFAGVL